jgi:MazG family protein
VFGGDDERASVELDGLWERVKAEEKAGNADAGGGRVLGGVPLALPALSRALKLQDKAARVGFDWPDMVPVFGKIREEIEELEDATNLEVPSRRKIAEELGDLLFVMANLARHMRIDPEDALRHANAKFARRFEQIEARLAAQSRTPAESDLAEMDRLWDEVKREENSGGE